MAHRAEGARRQDVEIVANGPGGVIHFRESSNVASFGWEFGGTPKVVVIIYVPAPADWDTKVPWAAGRRAEILEKLAREVCRQKCRGCGVEIEEHWIHITESHNRLW